jgi:hypothetical protein
MTRFRTGLLAFGIAATAATATLVVAGLAGADPADIPTGRACATAAGYLRLADSSGHCGSGDHTLTLPDTHLGQTYQNVANFTMIDTDPHPFMTIPAGRYQVSWSAQNTATVNEDMTHTTYTVDQTCTFQRSSGVVYDTAHQVLPLGRTGPFTASADNLTSSVVDISAPTSVVLEVLCTGDISAASGVHVVGDIFAPEFTKMSAVRIGALASHIDTGFARRAPHHRR